MPLKPTKGNMYDWVDATHSLLAGACPHGCSYCYVQAMARRLKKVRALHTGPVRLVDRELEVKYAPRTTVFIEHLSDLFAVGVPDAIIETVLQHLRRFPETTFVLQTKNPQRAMEFYEKWPLSVIFGTTIETNRWLPEIMGHAPVPNIRAAWMDVAQDAACQSRFVTIEPILPFDLEPFIDLLQEANPDFINVGADSKGTHLPEPTAAEVRTLIERLEALGFVVKQKPNLRRILEAKP